MGILEQIKEMKNQGMADNEIIDSLQQQGISPRQINDALSQSQIKSAVSGEEEPFEPEIESSQPQETYEPQTQELPEDTYEAPQPNQSYDEYYPQESYGYDTAQTTDSMMDIAEQVFSEKIKKIQKQVETHEEFKTLAAAKLQNISERLKRIETMFDQLQVKIIEKVGSYGKELSSVKKEISMVEDSFSKIAEKTEQKHTIHHKTKKKKPAKKKTKKTSKKK